MIDAKSLNFILIRYSKYFVELKPVSKIQILVGYNGTQGHIVRVIGP